MARKPKEVTPEEKHALAIAFRTFATALSKCVLGKPNTNFPRTLVTDWANVETLYSQPNLSLPELRDCNNNKRVSTLEAAGAAICTTAAVPKNFESALTDASLPDELASSMAVFEQMQRDKTDSWNASLEHPSLGQVRVTIDEVLSPAIDLLESICKELFVGFNFPLKCLRSEGQIYHLISNHRVDRVNWPFDVVRELERLLLNTGVKVDKPKPALMDRLPDYEIVQTRKDKYFAKLRTGEYRRFEPTDNERVFLVSMFNKWKELIDASTLFDLTRTVSDGTPTNLQGNSDGPTDTVCLSRKALADALDVDLDTVRTYINRFNERWAILTKDNGKVLIRKGDLVVVSLALDVSEFENPH